MEIKVIRAQVALPPIEEIHLVMSEQEAHNLLTFLRGSSSAQMGEARLDNPIAYAVENKLNTALKR